MFVAKSLKEQRSEPERVSLDERQRGGGERGSLSERYILFDTKTFCLTLNVYGLKESYT